MSRKVIIELYIDEDRMMMLSEGLNERQKEEVLGYLKYNEKANYALQDINKKLIKIVNKYDIITNVKDKLKIFKGGK